MPVNAAEMIQSKFSALTGIDEMLWWIILLFSENLSIFYKSLHKKNRSPSNLEVIRDIERIHLGKIHIRTWHSYVNMYTHAHDFCWW